MSTSVLVTVSFWRVLLERLGRQAAQTAYPVLSGAVAAGAVLDLQTVLIGLAMVEAVTLGKAAALYLASVRVTRSAPWWQQFLDRAVPAAAGTALAVPIVTWADAVSTDWAMVGQKAVVAAVLAQMAVYVTPPALTADRPLSVARSDSGRAGVLMVIVLAVLALAAAALLATPASAHAPRRPAVGGQADASPVVDQGQRRVVLNRALDCRGIVWLGYDVQTGATWDSIPDDGKVQQVEVLAVGGRYAPTYRRWEPIEQARVVRRSEGWLGFDARGLPTWTMARVAAGDGSGSNSLRVTVGCPG